MTEALGVVINSTSMDICPRVLLGMLCLEDTNFSCICSDVKTARVELVEDDNILRLTMEMGPYVMEWTTVRKGVELMGFKADYAVTGGGLHRGIEVVAKFDLSRRENAELREFAETGF